MEWKSIQQRYSSVKRLFIGKIAVAEVFWNSGRPKNSDLTHKRVMLLPGLKREVEVGEFSSEQEAMTNAEEVTKRWVKAAELYFNASE
ncbi:TPA: hypothetical protein QCI64_001538 [Enterobacter asburiae]|nr:hypothetical protein [Enterobacter asburiae]HCR2018684.1 hypothetical protein [Enterobacter asburiae]HCR2025497.1 hypothetical protein [Enterobacter asburiae]HCR2035165.1 hypothetical protein [Enterobacter asburiae]HCR2039345.1 hypothetical protein [Enterobacter asburiae]